MTQTTTAYRAATDTYTGPGACYAADRADAERYTERGTGHGGDTIHTVEIAADAVIVDIDRDTIIAAYGENAWYEHGQEYQVVEADPAPMIATGATHIRYTDDYPADCVTIQRIADGTDTIIASEHVGWTDAADDETATDTGACDCGGHVVAGTDYCFNCHREYAADYPDSAAIVAAHA